MLIARAAEFYSADQKNFRQEAIEALRLKGAALEYSLHAFN